MKTITQLKAEVSELQKKLTALRTDCTTNNREMTDDELDWVEDVRAELKSIRKKMKVLQGIEEEEDAMNDAMDQSQRSADRFKPEGDDQDLDGSDTQATQGQNQRSSIHVADQRKRDEFRSSSEFFGAVIQAGMPGGHIDPRLVTRATPTGMGEMIPSEGGFLVPDNFSTSVMQKAHEMSSIASRCQTITLTKGNSIEIPGIDETSRATGSRWGGVRGYWVGEAGEITASQASFERLKFKVKKLGCLCYVTEEMMEDYGATASLIETTMGGEIAFMLDDAVLNGDGVGKPQGILGSASLVTAAAESGQGAGTFIGHNIVQMWSQCFAACRKNAVWFINQNVEPQLLRAALQDAVSSPAWGFPVYMPPGGLSQSPYGTIMGKEVVPIEQAPALGTLGDVVLADMSQYILVKRGGINTDVSMHVRFVYDEQVLKATLRVDGQSSWSSALTPFKQAGSETLSPFVALSGTRT